MVTLIVREFTVNAAKEAAWDHLARVERWPSWARHIKRIDLKPRGELGPSSAGVIHLTNGMKSTFRMMEFHPHENWKWVGPFLWLTVYYDHRFVPLTTTRTKLLWIVAAEGFGAAFFGKVFAKIYRKNLEKAIPLLVSEMSAVSAIT